MPNLTYHSLGYNNASQFAEAFSEPQATVGYVTLGKTTEWADGTPPALTDTAYTSFEVFNTMIGGKKVVGNDVSLILPRRNWTANTVYTPFDDRQANLFDSANGQYIYTSSGAVYLCIENGNNSPSTIEPTGDFTVDNGFIDSTIDGYVWKYMYAIPPSSKFLTSSWIPVPSLQTQAYYGSSLNVVAGSLSRVIIESGGSGYYTENTSIRIVGAGTGANITPTISNGAITQCTINAVGSGYSYQNCSIQVIGVGTGANLRPVLSPDLGHAFNPARELGANTVMIAVKIGEGDATEGGKITANNDYRQISLLLAPHKYGDSTEISSANANSAVRMTTGIIVTSGSDFQRDELVYQGSDISNSTYQGVVVDYVLNTVYVNEEYGTIRPGVTLRGNTSAVTRTVVDTIHPELQPRTGELVYIENREPIIRALNQSENIKFVISFGLALCYINIISFRDMLAGLMILLT